MSTVVFGALKDYPGIKVLVWFLKNPEKKIYVRALARELNLNPTTVSKYLKTFYRRGFLSFERKGRLDEYTLNNSNVIVRELKKLFIVDAISGSGLLDCGFTHVILFGSCARGEYNEKSDIDIVVIGEGSIPLEVLSKIYEITGMEVNIHRFSFEEWLELLDKPFGKRIMDEKMVLKGEMI